MHITPTGDGKVGERGYGNGRKEVIKHQGPEPWTVRETWEDSYAHAPNGEMLQGLEGERHHDVRNQCLSGPVGDRTRRRRTRPAADERQR